MSGFLSKLFSWISPKNQKIQDEISAQIGSDEYFHTMKKVHFGAPNSNPFSENHYHVSTGTQTEARVHTRTNACGTMTDTVEFPMESFDLEPIKKGKEIKLKISPNQSKKTSTVKYGFQAPISNSGSLTFDFTFHSKDPDKSLKKDKPTTILNPISQHSWGKTSVGTFASQKSSHSDYVDEEEDQYSETNTYSNSTDQGSDQHSDNDTSNVTDE